MSYYWVIPLMLLGSAIGVIGVALAVLWSRRDDFEDGYRSGFVDASERMGLDPLDDPADPREPQRTH